VASLEQLIASYNDTGDKSIIESQEFYKRVKAVVVRFIKSGLGAERSSDDQDQAVQDVVFRFMRRVLNKEKLPIIGCPVAYIRKCTMYQAYEYYAEKEKRREVYLDDYAVIPSLYGFTGSYPDDSFVIDEWCHLPVNRNLQAPSSEFLSQDVYAALSEFLLQELQRVKDFLERNPYTKGRATHFHFLLLYLMFYGANPEKLNLDFRSERILAYLSSTTTTKLSKALNALANRDLVVSSV